MIGDILPFGDPRGSGRLIVALDGPPAVNLRLIESITKQAFPPTLFFKIGMTSVGNGTFDVIHEKLLKAAERLSPDRPVRIFWDLKLNDTLDTVRVVSRQASIRGVEFLTVSGRADVIQAALEGIRSDARGKDERYRTKVLTVPFISDQDMTREYHWVVDGLSSLSVADGIVCRAMHAGFFRTDLNEPKIFVCPGIREDDTSDTNSHLYPQTPGVAMRHGADFIVVGRPIWQADDPLTAAYRYAHAAHLGAGETISEGWRANPPC